MKMEINESTNNENELNERRGNAAVENVEQDSQEEIELLEAEAQPEEEQKVKLTKLPIGRVKSIIKTDPDVNLVNQEAVFLITKATELFIDSLAKESYKYTYQSKKKTVQKHDVQSAVDNVDALLFLDGIL